MSPFPTFAPEPFFPQEDSTVHQSCDQDFRGLFPPLHRPLSVLDISEGERGLWVYEQVNIVDGDDVCFKTRSCPGLLLCFTVDLGGLNKIRSAMSVSVGGKKLRIGREHLVRFCNLSCFIFSSPASAGLFPSMPVP